MLADAAPHHPVVLVEAPHATVHFTSLCHDPPDLEIAAFLQAPYLRFVRMLLHASSHHPVELAEASHIALARYQGSTMLYSPV